MSYGTPPDRSSPNAARGFASTLPETQAAAQELAKLPGVVKTWIELDGLGQPTLWAELKE